MSVESWSQGSQHICRHLLSLHQLRNASCVHVFWPMKEKREVDIRPVISHLFESGQTVLLPIVDGPVLKHARFTGEANLIAGNFGVLEPVFDERAELEKPDVVLVPALAVDTFGNRIGYGKGYYDSFLSQIETCKIVPLFTNQIVSGIPSEPHDVPVDILVTEHGVFPIT